MHPSHLKLKMGANASAGSGTFKVGQNVKIKDVTDFDAQMNHFQPHPRVGWSSSMAPFLGTIGEVKSVSPDCCTLYTPDKSDTWTWPFSILEHIAAAAPAVLKPTRELSAFDSGRLLMMVVDVVGPRPNIEKVADLKVASRSEHASYNRSNWAGSSSPPLEYSRPAIADTARYTILLPLSSSAHD